MTAIRSIVLMEDVIQIEYALPGTSYQDGLALQTAIQVPNALPYAPIAEEIAALAEELLEYATEEMTRRQSLAPVPEGSDDDDRNDANEGEVK